MTDAKHADFDALSAYIDGEAPEWADHVEGCPRCRATAADLRALAARVASPVTPPPAAQREAAIAAALGQAEVDAGAGAGARSRSEARPAGDGRPRLAPPRPTPATQEARRRWSPQSWALPAVAAVILAFVGLAGVILSGTRSTDHTETVAGPAPDAKSESAVAGAPQAPVGDLGDVPDAATLRARALGVTPAVGSAGRSSSSSSSGAAAAGAADSAGSESALTVAPPNAASAQSSATNTGNTGAAVSGGAGGLATAGGAGGAGGSAAATVTPNAVGTRPCEERARSRDPRLGPVTYFATARQGSVPTYVLGFLSGPNVTLLMLAQDGCAELLRSAGP